jgi:hypothetical protein
MLSKNKTISDLLALGGWAPDRGKCVLVTMQAFRTEARIHTDGNLTVGSLPFSPGETVEVIVLPSVKETGREAKNPLRGSVLRYDRPTDPVDEDEWESA